MKFRFPIVVIDEDYRSDNASGLGIRALAKALEDEGSEVLGVTSYGDLSSFAQQQSRASAFILSIDDEEFSSPVAADQAVAQLRSFVEESVSATARSRFSCTARRVPRAIFPMMC
jgi:ornithine decarboxylase (EC 4.1.1.17)